jgi:hypothetical protein
MGGIDISEKVLPWSVVRRVGMGLADVIPELEVVSHKGADLMVRDPLILQFFQLLTTLFLCSE